MGQHELTHQILRVNEAFLSRSKSPLYEGQRIRRPTLQKEKGQSGHGNIYHPGLRLDDR